MSISTWAFERLADVPVVFLQHWAYPILFLLCFFEGIPLLGFFIPGHTAMLLGGFFAKMGYLDVGTVWIIALVALFAGDLLAFELGRKYGHAFLVKYGKHFLFREQEYRDVRLLLAHHPGKAIILGKFNALTKAFAPFIAGASQMRRSRFLPYSLVAGALWTTCFVFIGYIFGHGFEQATKYVGSFALVALVFTLFLLYGYRRAQRFVLKHQHRILRHPLGLMFLASASLLLLGVVADNIVQGGRLTLIDAAINEGVFALRTPFLTVFSIILDFSFGLILLAVVSIVLFILLMRIGRRRTAAIFAFMMGFGFAMEQGIKLLGLHPRPSGGIVAVLTGSFPSGHATMATIFCLFLLWAFKDDIVRPFWRSLFCIALVATPFLVGFSRVYLGVHWVSDIVGGWALGLFIFSSVLIGAYLLRPLDTGRHPPSRRIPSPV